MKHLFYLFFLILITSCGNKKTLLLPEVKKSNTNEVLDVSPGYIFYDETKPDSLELNRKNLISTTNWLINVDKRLTLNQVMPSIIFLQEKKRNAKMHKNETAKNYYTCNDTSIKNLGFIDVVYHLNENPEEQFNNSEADQNILIEVEALNTISLTFSTSGSVLKISSNRNEFLKTISTNLMENGNTVIFSALNKNLTFQDYITYKSEIIELESDNVVNDNSEYIY